MVSDIAKNAIMLALIFVNIPGVLMIFLSQQIAVTVWSMIGLDDDGKPAIDWAECLREMIEEAKRKSE
jgi:hypothetical protein